MEGNKRLTTFKHQLHQHRNPSKDAILPEEHSARSTSQEILLCMLDAGQGKTIPPQRSNEHLGSTCSKICAGGQDKRQCTNRPTPLTDRPGSLFCTCA